MDERLRFVARLLEGDKMAVLCREFGISRKTGYKLYRRYRDIGLEGLTDRSRRPYRQANKLPFQLESRILQLRKEHPTWGAPKIREKLRRLELGVQTPAISTVHAVLDRHGLVTRRRRRRYKAQGTPLSWPRQPNQLWCADFKGEFMLADHRYCYPLTITDFVCRYLLACEALASTREHTAFTVFEHAFKEFGLPDAIRTDNGIPFSCPHAFFGLSRLSVWWLRLGIDLERIKPGHPQQNGRHERIRPSACATRPSSMRPQPAPTAASRTSSTRSTTTATSSPAAAASASITARSTSAPCSPARPSASNRSPTRSGWSASCTTILAFSTTNVAGWRPPRIHSALKCYPCPRNNPLPMCPEWTREKVVGGDGIEPSTPAV
jgi:transposase InsO family protein